ncbi:MAG: glycosyltransferase, partial [Parafilimonas sp.]
GHSTYDVGPVLVHVGGFTFEKNHAGLINIFERIVKKNTTASLHLIGDGILRNDIEEIVKKRNLDKKVCFHGYKKHVSQFIHNADVLLLPSLIEGLPGVILEAFACRTPVVAYDVGGVKEIVIPKHTGYLVEKGNEEEFASAILASLEKNAYNEMLIENAYRLVTSKYFNTQITKEFLNVYESIVS